MTVTKAKSSKDNLCDTCIYDYPECRPDEETFEFGNGIGNDNVIACNLYTSIKKEDNNGNQKIS